MKRRVFLAAMLAMGGLGSQAHAQEDWPTRAITWVVPFAAGGVTDTTSRRIAAILSEKLGQPVVVENKPGAGGIVGTESVANAKNDGYTVLYASSGPFSILPHLQKGKLSFDPIADFEQVRGVSASGQMLVVRPDARYNSIEELVAYAKANPGTINYGSPGIGTAQHLAGELLQAAAGIEMVHVPYKAGTSQMVDLMSGVLDLSFEYTPAVKPYVDEGKMKVIGTTAPERLPSYPDARTVVEAGYPDAVNVGWTSVALPKGVAPEIKEKLSKALDDTLKDPIMQKHFEANAQTPMNDLGPEEMTKYLIEANARFEKVITGAGIASQ
jgi:tripartite-type tricarboxylate transporter receptor subunit TctC